MEEDELGTLHELGHSEYVTCSRCGATVAREAAAIAPGEALEDASEYRYLCSACQAALADGEPDLSVLDD